MSVNPNAPLGQSRKCTTCSGDDEKKNQNIQLAGDPVLLRDGSTIDFQKSGVNEIVTIYNPDGIETSTWHVGPDGHQLKSSPGGAP